MRGGPQPFFGRGVIREVFHPPPFSTTPWRPLNHDLQSDGSNVASAHSRIDDKVSTPGCNMVCLYPSPPVSSPQRPDLEIAKPLLHVGPPDAVDPTVCRTISAASASTLRDGASTWTPGKMTETHKYDQTLSLCTVSLRRGALVVNKCQTITQMSLMFLSILLDLGQSLAVPIET